MLLCTTMGGCLYEMMQYTGSLDAICPITLSTVSELKHPVAIRADPAQPYELTPLWKWLLISNRHPLTGQTCSLCDIVPLQLCGRSGCDTEAVLEGLNLTIVDTQVMLNSDEEMRLIEGPAPLSKSKVCEVGCVWYTVVLIFFLSSGVQTGYEGNGGRAEPV
jgi:hypothetical protein